MAFFGLSSGSGEVSNLRSDGGNSSPDIDSVASAVNILILADNDLSTCLPARS